MSQQPSEHRVGERASNSQRTSTEQANLDLKRTPRQRRPQSNPWEPAGSPTSSVHLVSVMDSKRRRRADDRDTWLGDLLGASVDVAHGASEVWICMCSCVGEIGGADAHVFVLCFMCLAGLMFMFSCN